MRISASFLAISLSLAAGAARAQQTTEPDPRPPATAPAPVPGSPPTTAPPATPAPSTAPPGAPPPPNAPPPQYGPSPAGAYPYPPPGYAPYQYPPPYPYPPPHAYGPQPAPQPAELPYAEGDAIPPGYSLESRVRRGPVIAGTILFATTYGINLLVASIADGSDDANWLYVPGVGTWPLVDNACERDGGDDGCEFLILHSAAHTFGLGLLIYGIAAQKSVLVRDSKVRVLPARIGSGSGLALDATF